MRTYRYQPIPLTQADAAGIREIDGFSPVDLSQEAADALANGLEVQAVRIYIFEDDKPTPFAANALYLPSEGRLGIEWGANASWVDVDNLESGIDMWLNEPDEWEARS